MLHGDAEGLADDLELAFDAGAQEGIGVVVLEALPSRKVRQQVAGREDIQQPRPGITRHTTVAATTRCLGEDRDCEQR